MCRSQGEKAFLDALPSEILISDRKGRKTCIKAIASPKIEAVVRERHRMAECPVWEEETGQLVYVDINAGNVCRWSPRTGEVQTVGLRNRVGSVALCPKGTYVVATGTCLGFLDWGTQQVRWVARLDRDKPRNRFNDGKVDPAGRFVAGTMPEASAPGVWERGQGSLYTLRGPTPGRAGHPQRAGLVPGPRNLLPRAQPGALHRPTTTTAQRRDRKPEAAVPAASGAGHARRAVCGRGRQALGGLHQRRQGDPAGPRDRGASEHRGDASVQGHLLLFRGARATRSCT
ncbi:uncharacterized protein [Eulemur rufifrons]|uniref:uncharacterized protein n=1 Tax=Eulemur rufifrons TaxID=859984 RepID=UPI003743111A